MKYLIFFAQAYANFRVAELESLAAMYNIPVDLSHHDESSPFMVVDLASDEHAKKLVERSILAKGIYEVWGHGTTVDELRENTKQVSSHLWPLYKNVTFKFEFESYMGSRPRDERFAIIESFLFLAFEGRIRLKDPEVTFTILEEYHVSGMEKAEAPLRLWLGRQVQLSTRSHNILDKYDLKRRKFIGTTSFDAELSLVSCNVAQVDSGKVVYDPFTGTGSFLVAAANFGGYPIGSDIDARTIRGKSKQCNLRANFQQYGTSSQFIDTMVMDFTNNALHMNIDTIVCDPPYGVREGLKVLGAKNEERAAARREGLDAERQLSYLKKDYIPAKKPYELANMLEDLLGFAAARLPVGGRLVFWMPTANDEFEVHNLPQHERLQLLYNLEQEFNKWLRRLLVYVKRESSYKGETINGLKVGNVTNFRERYFTSFRTG